MHNENDCLLQKTHSDITYCHNLSIKEEKKFRYKIFIFFIKNDVVPLKNLLSGLNRYKIRMPP